MGNKSGGASPSKKSKGGTRTSKQSSKKPIKFGRKAQIPQSKLDRVKITKSLNLEKCKYSSMPPNLFMIHNLEIVNLNDNNIKNIDEELIPPFDDTVDDEKKANHKKKKYKGIKLLRMNNNKLSALPQSFINLQNLQTLQLIGNHFEYFPAVLFKLPKLKELSLKNNQIQIIECSLQIIEGVKKLIELDLSYNKLQVLCEEFTHLKSLKVVNFEENQLRQLPVSWTGMESLHIINLRNNCLQTIPKSLFVDCNVVRIDMEQNPVHSSKKYVHLEGFDQFSERHKKHWDKGDVMGADRTHHTI